MNSLPKDASQQLDWLTDYINGHIDTLKPEAVAGIVLRMAAARISLMRLQNGQTDDADFEALQRELGG